VRVDVNDAKVVGVVRDLARQYPDAVYRSPTESGECFYHKGVVENGPDRPGCIMREVVLMAGGSEHENEAIHAVVEGFVSAAVRTWCRIVQREQDAGKSWSEAVRLADESGHAAEGGSDAAL
jgi:hypothetical protein